MTGLKIEIDAAELGGYVIHFDSKRMALWGQGEMVDAVIERINAAFGVDPLRRPMPMPAVLDGSRDAENVIALGDNPTLRRGSPGLAARVMKAVGG